jgi:hypothetical protein
MENYEQQLETLIDMSFTNGVKAEQVRLLGELKKILSVKDSVSSPDWQEGFVIALNLVSRVIEHDRALEGEQK